MHGCTFVHKYVKKNMHTCPDTCTPPSEGLSQHKKWLGHKHWATQGEDISTKIYKGDAQTSEVRWTWIYVLMQIHLLARVCDQRRDGWGMHNASHRRAHFVLNYANRLAQMLGLRWTGIHVLMHVHLLAMVHGYMMLGRDMQIRTCRDAHICTQLCQKNGADVFIF